MITMSLVLMLMSLAFTRRLDSSILYARIGLIIVIYSIILTLVNFHVTYLEQGISLYNGLFVATCLTHAFQLFAFIIAGLLLSLSAFYPRKRYLNYPLSILKAIFLKIKEYFSIVNKVTEQFTILEYALIVIFVITGTAMLLISSDFGSIYLCLELQSFSLYIISSLHRNSETSVGSALTYFLLGGLSSCFILLGIALIYSNSGLTKLEGIYTIISDSEIYVNFSNWYIHNYVFFCLIIMSVGFLFKIAAAPFHWWSPDVYDGVPTIVTAFIALMGKIAILILLLELVYNTNSVMNSTVQVYSWTTSLTLSCLFSLVIGTLLGLTQMRIKKLLAYSTISHIGFILIALTAFSIESFDAFIFYIFQYIITNLNAFIIIIAIGFSLYLYYSSSSEQNKLREKNNSPIQLISQLKGYLSVNPMIALCLIITMFSFVGLPPLIGFFGKQLVLTAALNKYKYILVLVAILTSVIGAVYYLNIIKTMWFDITIYYSPDTILFSLSTVYSVIMASISLITLGFICIPDSVLNLSSFLSEIDFSYVGLEFTPSDSWTVMDTTTVDSSDSSSDTEGVSSKNLTSVSSDVKQTETPMHGVRCPVCKARGQEVWVIPGTRCHKCGNPC